MDKINSKITMNLLAEEEVVIRHTNRALGDAFLKVSMVLGQTMRFSKTTDYKLAHAPGGLHMRNSKWPPVDKNIHNLASTDDILKHSTTFLMFLSMKNSFLTFIVCLNVTEIKFVYIFLLNNAIFPCKLIFGHQNWELFHI